MSLNTLRAIGAIHTALVSDPSFSGVVGNRVYTAVVKNPTFPYCVIRTSSAPYDTKGFNGSEIMVTLQVFSRYNGSKETLEILGHAYNALHDQNITVTGANLVNLRFDNGGDAVPEPDGKTWQGLATYRIVLQG